MLKVKSLALLLAIIAFGIAQAYATNVTFQVNMSVQTDLGNFAPATDNVVARGSFNGWAGDTHMLIAQGEGIYAGTFDISVGDHEFKFVKLTVANPSGDWESVVNPDHGNNRFVSVGNDPITLPVVYFSDISSSGTASLEVNFRVDMSVQILTGNFDPETDWIVIRGGHANIGNWGGVTRLTEETGNPGVYSLWVQFDSLSTATPLAYKFFIAENGDPNDPDGWEQRPGGDRTILPTGEEPDLLPPPNGNGFGEIMPALVFYADVSADDIITQDVTVTIRVEIAPLLGRLQDQSFIFDPISQDTIFSVESIQICGARPAFSVNWAWDNTPPEYFLNDAGTNGDLVAGDGVWSRAVLFPAGTPRTLEYKYGCNQHDVEARGGAQWNHYRTIDDSQPTFMFDIDCFGSTDNWYAGWPCLISDVDDNGAPIIGDFALEQNYPNPFNPTTSISFTLSHSNLTSLNVFNVLGRTVATLNLGRMDAGHHTISFDGSNLSSGVYFYQLESGAVNATRKMLLLK